MNKKNKYLQKAKEKAKNRKSKKNKCYNTKLQLCKLYN